MSKKLDDKSYDLDSLKGENINIVLIIISEKKLGVKFC